jgi:nucleoside-diphosphate-sugar epimerase
MKVVIIGKRSFLSNRLNKLIEGSQLVSSNYVRNKKFAKTYVKNDTVFIINSFYPLFKILNNSTNNKELIKQSVIFLINLLNKISKKKNIKIIYSSTCAVKSFNPNLLSSRSVYSSTKLLCEQILNEFCSKFNIELIITRLFNLYGGNDKASIIYKIISASNKKKLKINNNGNSKRDFIYVDDVCEIYKNLIKSNFTGLIDLGTGKSTAIRNLVDLSQKKYFLSKKKIYEDKISKANIKKLSDYYDPSNFKDVKKYIKDNLKKN